RTWASQQAGLREMAAMAEMARAHPTPTPSDLRSQVAGAYARAGLQRNDAEIDAATTAVSQRHAQDGTTQAQAPYFLQVQADGALATISGQNDQRMEIRSVVTPEEIARARPQPPTVSDPPQPAAPLPPVMPSRGETQPSAPAPRQSHGYRSPASPQAGGHHDDAREAAAQTGQTAELAPQQPAALTQQAIIEEHARLAAEHEETRRQEDAREQARNPQAADEQTQAGPPNPWDETLAGRYINRYMAALERGDEAEMDRLADIYAQTPQFKEWEAWGQENAQRLALEEQQQQQQQQQQEQHHRVLIR
ncbi:hypothetical protein EBB59_03440, partial [Lysobacter pythonis]